jgi:hypothetical protein
VADLSNDIGYGTVTGFFFAGDGDSPDAGSQPDIVLLTGSITLSHTLPDPFVRTTRGMMAIRSVLAKIIDGQVYGPSGPSNTDPTVLGANIIASDQDTINPAYWQWIATFNIDGLSKQPAPVRFSLAPGDIVDLSLVYDSPSSTPAVMVLVNEADRVAAEQAAQQAAQYAAQAQAAGRNFVILGPNDPVPAGTPDGAVIFRKPN